MYMKVRSYYTSLFHYHSARDFKDFLHPSLVDYVQNSDVTLRKSLKLFELRKTAQKQKLVGSITSAYSVSCCDKKRKSGDQGATWRQDYHRKKYYMTIYTKRRYSITNFIIAFIILIIYFEGRYNSSCDVGKET